MKIPVSALLLSVLAIQLSAPAGAQLAMHAESDLQPGVVAVAFQPRTGKGVTSSTAAQVPLGVANEIQMLRTMAGPKALRPAFAKCDASELSLGQPGEAFVAGDIRIINTGQGKCPEIGKSFKDPGTMLERMR